ncbi:MAG: hypothetical protein V4506_19705 [Bacteroidota bacterium]
MEKKFNIDEHIRQSLRDFEVSPDNSSFDAILKKMNQKKKRRGFFILFWTGLVALTGVAAPLLWLTFGNQKTKLTQPHKMATVAEMSSNTEAHTKTHINTSIEDSTGISLQSKNTSIENSNQSISKQALENTHAISQKENKSAGYNTSFNSLKSDSMLLHNASKLLIVLEKQEKNEPSNSFTEQQNNTSLTRMKNIAEPFLMASLSPSFTYDSIQADISEQIRHTVFPDSLFKPKKEKQIWFNLGIMVSPQLNSFAYSKNPQKDPSYDINSNFSDFYLKNKRKQRNTDFSIPFGIRIGATIYDKYEVFVGFGFQTFKEKIYGNNSSIITPFPNNLSAFSVAPGSTYTNVFRYYSYSLEANRLFKTTGFFKFKIGIGFNINQALKSDSASVRSHAIYYSNYLNHKQLSSCLLTAKLKAGVILNGNKRFQIHLSPEVFYAPTSIFKNDYVIRQKPYGFNLECLFLFRLFNIHKKQ